MSSVFERSPAPRADGPPPEFSRRSRRDLVVAWLSAALVFVALPVGRAASIALLESRGYDQPIETEPPGLGLASFLLLASIVVVPAGAAAWFGWRAWREGHPSGAVAAIVAAVIGGGLVLLGLPVFLSRLLGWPVVLTCGALLAAMVIAIARRRHRHPAA